MTRDAGSFKRGGPRLRQAVALVICEDARSSREYLIDAKAHFRAVAEIEVIHSGHTDPLGIVRTAISRSKKYDTVLCVIDRDTHDQRNFGQAQREAAASGKVQVFTSYPCCEYWLLLHFQYVRAPYQQQGKRSPADCALRHLREQPEMADYAKGSVKGLFDKLLPRLAAACRHAERSMADAEADAEKNPSTSMHQVIASFKRLGKPQPI